MKRNRQQNEEIAKERKSAKTEKSAKTKKIRARKEVRERKEFRQMNWLSLANTKGNQCSRGASRKQEQNTKRTITGKPFQEDEASRLAVRMQGDPLDASLVLTVSGIDPETEYREREQCLRSATNFTQQPRSSTNGCCLLASLVNIVDHPKQNSSCWGMSGRITWTWRERRRTVTGTVSSQTGDSQARSMATRAFEHG